MVWSTVVAYSLLAWRIVFHVKPDGVLAMAAVLLFGFGLGYLVGIVHAGRGEQARTRDAMLGLAEAMNQYAAAVRDGNLTPEEMAMLDKLARVVPFQYPDTPTKDPHDEGEEDGRPGDQ